MCKIKAPNYNVSKGRVKLTTSDSTYVEKVKLIPNFGYLEVQDPGNASGAKVFVNNEEVGTVPYKKRYQMGLRYIRTVVGERPL